MTTTAAPPEKMTPCRCSDTPAVRPHHHLKQVVCASCGRHGPIGSNEAFAIAGWNADCEAARRLSAPAPAAPRVGDGAQSAANAQAYAHGYRLDQTIGSAPPATRVESHKCPECGWRTVMKPPFPGDAPPATSADEAVSELARLVVDGLSYVKPGEPGDIARSILAAGYRKRAAQGVAEDGNDMERAIANRLNGNWLLAAGIAEDIRALGYWERS